MVVAGTGRAEILGSRIEVKMTAKFENLAVLRNMAATAAQFECLDGDAVADLRIAVDEVCTWLMRVANPDSPLVMHIDPQQDRFVVEASVTYDGPSPEHILHGSFSWHVLTALTEEVSTFTTGEGQVIGISLVARQPSLQS